MIIRIRAAADLAQDFYKTALAEYSDEVGTLMGAWHQGDVLDDGRDR